MSLDARPDATVSARLQGGTLVRGGSWLLGCALVGEVLVQVLSLPIPGAIVGMLMLLTALRVAPAGHSEGAVLVGTGLLHHLQLFFVPSGVGVVAYASHLRDDAAAIAVAMLASWALALVTVATTATGLARIAKSLQVRRSARSRK